MISEPVISTDKYIDLLERIDPIRMNGRVTQVIGLTIESEGPQVSVGEVCLIYPQKGKEPIKAEVVGFRENRVILMPLGELTAIGPGCEVVATGKPLSVKVGFELLGKVLNGLGEPLDGSKLPVRMPEYSTFHAPGNPLEPPARDGAPQRGHPGHRRLLTVGKGQRVGIFAGTGVGKSTLLGMMARNTACRRERHRA